jgi:hypothetical protein
VCSSDLQRLEFTTEKNWPVLCTKLGVSPNKGLFVFTNAWIVFPDECRSRALL